MQKGAVLNVEQTRINLIDGITKAISVRFDDMSNDFEPTIIASLKNWPTESELQGANVVKTAWIHRISVMFCSMHVCFQMTKCCFQSSPQSLIIFCNCGFYSLHRIRKRSRDDIG